MKFSTYALLAYCSFLCFEPLSYAARDRDDLNGTLHTARLPSTAESQPSEAERQEVARMIAFEALASRRGSIPALIISTPASPERSRAKSFNAGEKESTGEASTFPSRAKSDSEVNITKPRKPSKKAKKSNVLKAEKDEKPYTPHARASSASDIASTPRGLFQSIVSRLLTAQRAESVQFDVILSAPVRQEKEGTAVSDIDPKEFLGKLISEVDGLGNAEDQLICRMDPNRAAVFQALRTELSEQTVKAFQFVSGVRDDVREQGKAADVFRNLQATLLNVSKALYWAMNTALMDTSTAGDMKVFDRMLDDYLQAKAEEKPWSYRSSSEERSGVTITSPAPRKKRGLRAQDAVAPASASASEE